MELNASDDACNFGSVGDADKLRYVIQPWPYRLSIAIFHTELISTTLKLVKYTRNFKQTTKNKENGHRTDATAFVH